MNPRQSRNTTIAACVICHKKKVKCDIESVTDVSGRCSNCTRDDYECVRRPRKKKRYTLSPSPPSTQPKRRRTNQGISSPSRVGGSLLTATNDIDLHNGVQASGGVPNTLILQTPSSNAASDGKETETRSEDGSNFNAAYLDRAQYVSSSTIAIDEDPESYTGASLSASDLQILNIQKVLDLPNRAVHDSLLFQFWTYCYPWTPIVARDWIENTPKSKISPLLLQSILLAGSRVSPITAESYSEDLYRKGKTLFWLGAEKDPLIMTISSILLNWWNPFAPNNVSIDTSAFWIRIGVTLAYQIGLHKKSANKSDSGLRKRVWWSLVARDCLINAAHGRPRAIDQRLTNVELPTLEDFLGSREEFELFSAYLGICMILGDLTQSFLEPGKSLKELSTFELRLFKWIKTLPTRLQLYTSSMKALKPYSLQARQINIQYFSTLLIFYRPINPKSAPSVASILASSFISGMFEELLIRDDLRYLGPMFSFYLLASGVVQLSCYRWRGLWSNAQKDFEITLRALEELGERWQSASGSLKNLISLREKITTRHWNEHLPENRLTAEQKSMFEDFGPDLCRQWDALWDEALPAQSTERDLETAGILNDLRMPMITEYPNPRQPQQEMAAFAHGNIGMGHAETEWFSTQLLNAPDLLEFGGIGNWLFSSQFQPDSMQAG